MIGHDVWNLKNENIVEIVHEPRRGNIATLESWKILRLNQFGKIFQGEHVGPVTLSPILLSNGPEHLYTILNENPKLQPNP